MTDSCSATVVSWSSQQSGIAVLATGPVTAAAAGDEKPKLSGTVTVFAATSLPAAFKEIARDFREKNPDVRVELGNADAAIVYVTDVMSAEQVTGVSIPDAQNVTATYPIAVLQQSSNRKAVRAFVAYVLSTRGQLTLQEFGFLAP